VRKGYLVAAGIGAAIGSAATFVYLNFDPLERTVAAADGFSRWSLWQVPFTAPEAGLGAAAGVVVFFIARAFRRRVRA
jgi:hypothetical protein